MTGVTARELFSRTRMRAAIYGKIQERTPWYKTRVRVEEVATRNFWLFRKTVIRKVSWMTVINPLAEPVAPADLDTIEEARPGPVVRVAACAAGNYAVREIWPNGRTYDYVLEGTRP